MISVSDGTNSVALPAFSIAANSVTLGSATLSWVAPTQNTDGSALTNLAGYRVLYGKTRGGPYESSVYINNPSVTRYVVEGLVPGTYYFVVTARNSAGVESGYSGEATRTL